MDFPVFHLDFLGNRMLVAMIAVVHVMINHSLAVGAMEKVAERAMELERQWQKRLEAAQYQAETSDQLSWSSCTSSRTSRMVSPAVASRN